jgi:hypothetical protein
MLYDLTKPITDIQGKPLHADQKPGPDGKGFVEDTDSAPLTLGIVLIRAALYVEGGTNPPAEEKFHQAELADKIVRGGESVDLTTEEMGRLRTAVGRMYMPTILFRVWRLLDAHVGTERPN